MKALMEKLEGLLEWGGIKKDVTLLVISGIAVICSLAKWQPFSFDMAWIAIILCGVPIVLEAIIGLVTAFDIKADVLVSLALIASVCIGQDFAAGEVAFIMQLGGLLEELTVAKARAGIEKLVHLTPRTARVLRGGAESMIPAEQVQVGNTLRGLPGECVPVDGVILSGQTSINQAVMTGESLPVDKSAGDEVSSGTMNQFGAFEMRATRVGADSSIQRMIRLVQSADAGKAKIVGIADRWAKVKVVAFDKTGTLTYGTPEVVAAVSVQEGLSHDELYRLAASAEQMSEHPLGKAIVRGCKRSGAALADAGEFRMIPGRGVSARVEGRGLLAGNPELLREQGVTLPEEAGDYLAQGCTVTYLAVDGTYAGYIALSDTIRQESAEMVDALTALGVQPVLLTGDHENAARAIAQRLHIQEVRANCLPEDKMTAIDGYQAQGRSVCMMGDGVNDAPALKRAEVGIAMGGVGSDIAVDAADIALVDDEVKELPHLIALSHRMMTTIKLNMTFSMALNFAAIILAIIGTLNPVVGALVHNAGSVLVITNSAFLLNWKKK